MIVRKMRNDELGILFGHLQFVKAHTAQGFRFALIILKDSLTNEFLVGPNDSAFLSMFLRYSSLPEELFGAAPFEGCDTVALCVRFGDTLRVYFLGNGNWDAQGELQLCQKRRKILRIELVDRTINEKWNFAGIGMRVVYEAPDGKGYTRVYDNALRPLGDGEDK